MKKSPSRSAARRDFLRRSGVAFGFLMGDVPVFAQEVKPKAPAPPPAGAKVQPVTCAVVGLGDQGREILKALGAVPGADVKVVCDSYEGAHKRAQQSAPKALAVADFRKVLDDKSIQAVFVATPTFQHKDLAVAALQAGKHVYCEAPLAHSIDDARAIAKAALAAPKQVFQPGLQRRVNHLEKHVAGFFRTGVLGRLSQGSSQWCKKTSWRRPAPTPEREAALNWRLSSKTSTGLCGEVGLHQFDLAAWFLRELPTAVTGWGSLMAWKDNRDVQDTAQCVLEFGNGYRHTWQATLGNSFGGTHDVLRGTDAAIMCRESKAAWMFKEADAPTLGWEVYAAKENVGEDSGIALVANATKLLDEGRDPAEHRDAYLKGALYYACESFLDAVRGAAKVEVGAKEGFEATVIALKANEAVTKNTKVVYKPEWFTI